MPSRQSLPDLTELWPVHTIDPDVNQSSLRSRAFQQTNVPRHCRDFSVILRDRRLAALR